MIVVPAGTPLTRLDVFLARHTDLSRSQLQKHIKAGTIQQNGKATKPHHLVHPGDSIRLQELSVTYQAEPIPVESPEPKILLEDDRYLVVEKPTGMVVHGGPGIHEPTLADWAVKHDPKIAEVGDRPEERPGIVHRLDREVSGVMVIAKTKRAYEGLKQQFQEHSIMKEYLALVHGRLTDQHGRISFAIARKADKSGLMVARPASLEGKQAETKFTVERFVKNLSLVRVQTLTGRTHQIRVHFKSIGHALVGDPLYKNRGQKKLKITPPRIFLHAMKLGFMDLSRQPREFQSPLPSDLQQYLARVS